MNNGLTDVFISVLSLSSSSLASTNAEIDLAIWLTTRDQNQLFGRGCVGFDLSEMPWNPDKFEELQRFMLRSISSAKNKEYWNLLDYEPNEEWVLNSLSRFEELINDFSVEYVSEIAHKKWLADKPKIIEKCPKHNVFKHWQGCVVCGD